MKNRVIYQLIIVVIGMTFASCQDFLTIEPKSNFGTTSSFYKNEKDIEYLLNATYANLQVTGYYRENMVLLTDVRSDDLGTFGNTGGNAGREYSIKNFTAQSDNQVFRDTWSEIYQMIFNANKVIANIDVVKDEKLKKQYEAEARFLRALCYFNIVRLWGGAPVLLEPLTPSEAATSKRNSAEEVYSAIENDLLFASDSNNLPKSFSGDDLGRATSLAAKALLGKVYVQEQKWTNAVQTLQELINTDNSGTHSLLPDIANVFSTAPAIKSSNAVFKSYTGWKPQVMNKEILFEVLFNKDIVNEGRNALTYYANQADLNEDFKISSSTCIYAKTDRRADLMRNIKGTNTDNNLLVKYADIQSSLGQYGYPTPIIRWADVLLLYAEALNEVNYVNSANSEALKLLNQVRTRSYPEGAYTINDLPTQDAFRKAIWNERRLEFPMEMQRWFDLVRTGQAIEKIGKIGYTIKQTDLLYPIPNSEIQLRNDPEAFPQNPGY